MSFLDERKLFAKRDERSLFLAGLATSPIGFSASDRIDAAKSWDAVERLRNHWLVETNRRLPTPEYLDRQRYGAPNRGGVRYGRD